jgi:hypothetical protein
MIDSSGTTADEQSNRIVGGNLILTTLPAAGQLSVAVDTDQCARGAVPGGAIDTHTPVGQMLLLMGLALITAGLAKVAFAGRQSCSRQRNRTICAEWRQERSSGSPVASSRMESFSCSSPASTGYLLYRAFWITGGWLGGFPVRSVSADTQGRVGIEVHAGTDMPALKCGWITLSCSRDAAATRVRGVTG